MKTTIIYLGILATMFVNTTVANEITRENQNQYFEQVTTELNFILDSTSNNKEIVLKKPVVISESEFNFIESDLNHSNKDTKSIVEIIEEDKKITDYKDEYINPLILNKTIEEEIIEGNQIIESSLTNEVFPLDFELIKKYENALKSEVLRNTAFDKSALKS